MKEDVPHRRTWVPTSSEERLLVSNALEEILASAPFRGSRRYPAMLRYVVEKTLTDQQLFLKERTIGIEVFGRDPDYDTNTDPVVRFSAGEIRRRIAQFYQESGTASRVTLELPSGSYVPRFHLIAALQEEDPAQADPAQISTPPGSPPLFVEAARNRPTNRWLSYALPLVLLIVLAGLLLPRFRPNRADPVEEVWRPLLTNPDPVVISAGRPVDEGEPPPSPNISIQDHILRPEFRVSISTLDAIANIVGYLKSNQKPFRIHEANSNTLADLHNRPVVLVTGNNNKWTVLLLKSLRFHFVQEGQFSYIADTRNPSSRDWNIDFTKPFKRQTTDYAIVGRFNSATTGGPIIVVAGISSNGTEAAGEFIVSPEALTRLEKLAPSPSLNLNFEAVLKVEVVDGNTGGTTVVASQFW